MSFIFITCLLICFYSGNTANILIIAQMPLRSHYQLSLELARVLVEAGHNITIVSPFYAKNVVQKNYWTDIVLDGFYEEIDDILPDLFTIENLPSYFYIFSNIFGHILTEKILRHKAFDMLISSNSTFDLIVMEQYKTDALKGLVHRFKAPLILFSPHGSHSDLDYYMGNPLSASYIPNLFLGCTSPLTFVQRVQNSFYIALSKVVEILLYLPYQNYLLRKHFPNAPDLQNLNQVASLMFLNSDISTHPPKPNLPNIIEIGGFHISPLKKLSLELQTFLDNASEGVVYFSLGSIVKSSNMPTDVKLILKQVLCNLEQKVLWKWDDDFLFENCHNVKIMSWVPQTEVLAHPNTKLFLSHGGLLSVMEAVYFGKPVLLFPFVSDTYRNAAQCVHDGFAISLSIKTMTENQLKKNIYELISNKTYSQNAKEQSKIMRDKMVQPKEKIIFWVEYVIRHKGASFLRSPALNLTWYEYLLLDVILLFILVSLAWMLLILKLIKYIKLKNKIKTS